MADPSRPETTELLRAWAGGDRQALTALVPRVHHELCRLAGHFPAKRASECRCSGGPCAGGLSAPRRCRSVGLAASAHFFAVRPPYAANPAGSRAPAFCGEARADAGSDRIWRRPSICPRSSHGNHRTRRGLNELAEIDPRKARIVECASSRDST